MIYQRERGLYESWNDAISNALYSYCYISTIGDLPDLERLEAFLKKAILSNDISISPPRVIIKEDTPEVLYNHWPIHKIISEFSIDTPIFLETELLSEIAYCVSDLHHYLVALLQTFLKLNSYKIILFLLISKVLVMFCGGQEYLKNQPH